MATNVKGTVLDPWGRPAVGVPVSLIDDAGALLSGITDAAGAYSISIASTAAATLHTVTFGVTSIQIDNTASGQAIYKWCGAYGYPQFSVPLNTDVTKNGQMRVL